jgi:HD-GYP domain-containing protein (c-di-GMP phosphodiesterase class II)
MLKLKLILPVHDFENRVVMEAGTEITDDALSGFISSSESGTYDVCSLLEFGSIEKDLLSFLSIPPYSAIFSEQEQIDKVLKVFEPVRLMLPVLQCIDYFKKQDLNTYKHMIAVFALSTLVAGDLISDKEEVLNSATTGPTHDLGKICVLLDVLRKETPLTEIERTILHQHTLSGYALISYYIGGLITCHQLLPGITMRERTVPAIHGGSGNQTKWLRSLPRVTSMMP